MNAAVLIVEGLSPALVGAYGSNTARTPALDRLAVDGYVLDQCFVDSVDLHSQLVSLWTGQHALQRQARPASTQPLAGPSLWQQCLARRQEHCLITDCPLVAEVAQQLNCDEVILIDSVPSTQPVSDASESCALSLFAAAAELLSDRQGLVWIHSRGLKLPWDVPISERAEFADPEDPPPPPDIGPPVIEVSRETDPDLVVGWGQVAAAQTAVLDHGLAALADVVASRGDADDWSWLVSSLGGVPLGEHGRVGWGEPELYGEEIQTVTIYRASQRLRAARSAGCGGWAKRHSELFQLPDLNATVRGLLGLSVNDGLSESPAGQDLEQSWGRNILQVHHWLLPTSGPAEWLPEFQLAAIRDVPSGRRWIRCPAWSASFQEQSTKLFVKPEDRWEVNDVADRRSDICEQLEALEAKFADAALEQARGRWQALPAELTNLLR